MSQPPQHETRNPSLSPARWHLRANATLKRRSGRRTVLVVDDDRDTRETLALLLELAGHDVRVAQNGTQALQIAKDLQPNVVFLDIRMPIVNGYAVCRQLRELAGCEESRIYALSGVSGPEHDRQCEAAGFTGQLMKPLEPALLSRVV